MALTAIVSLGMFQIGTIIGTIFTIRGISAKSGVRPCPYIMVSCHTAYRPTVTYTVLILATASCPTPLGLNVNEITT